MSISDLNINIEANVKEAKELTRFKQEIEKLGGISDETGGEIDALVNSINDIAAAQKIAGDIASATQKLEEQGDALEKAKKQYADAEAALLNFGEAMAATEKKEAEKSLRAQAQEVGKLERAYQRTGAELDRAKTRYSESSEYIKRLADDAGNLEEATRLAGETQARLNKELEGLKDIALARSDLGVTDYQQEIDRLTASYETLKRSGTLTAHELEAAHNRLNQQVSEYRRQLDGTANAQEKIKKGLPSFVAASAAFGKMANDAIKYESAMAGVGKVLGEGKEKVKELGNALLDMSETTRTSATGLAAIAESGAQIGLKSDELIEYTRQVSEMAVAFEMTADQAGKSVANLMNVFNLSVSEVEDFADAINHLAADGAANAASIVEVLTRIGGAGRNFGLARDEMAALSSAFVSLGMTPEVAGTAINNFLNTLNLAESKGKKFDDALRKIGTSSVKLSHDIKENPQAALMDFLQTIDQAAKDGENVSTILADMFGADQGRVALLAGSVDLLGAAFERVGDAGDYANSVVIEAATQNETTAGQLDLMRNKINRISIDIGNHLLPMVLSFAQGMGKIAEVIGEFTRTYPAITKLGMLIVGLSASLKLLGGLFALVGVQARRGFAMATTAATAFTAQMTAMRGALSVLTGPAGLLMLAAGGVTAFALSSKGAEKELTGLNEQLGRTREELEGLTSAQRENEIIKLKKSIEALNYEILKSGVERANASKEATRLAGEEADSYHRVGLRLRNAGLYTEEWTAKERELAAAIDTKEAHLRDLEQQLSILNSTEEKRAQTIESVAEASKGAAFAMVEQAQAQKNEIEEVAALLERQGLNYREIFEGITDQGGASIEVFQEINAHAAGTSEIIRESFIKALKDISTPQELSALIEGIEETGFNAQLAGNDLDLLESALDRLGIVLGDSTLKGEAFTEALKKEVEALELEKKGLYSSGAAHEARRAQVAKSIAQAKELNAAEVAALEAQLSLARARGDTAREQQLINEIAEKSIEAISGQIEPMRELIHHEQQLINELEARAAANETLTASELEQIETLTHSINIRKEEIKALEASTEVAKINNEERKRAEVVEKTTEATNRSSAALIENSEAAGENASALKGTAQAADELGESTERTTRRGGQFTTWLKDAADTALMSAAAIEKMSAAAHRVNMQWDRRTVAPTAMVEFMAKQREYQREQIQKEIDQFKALKKEIEGLSDPTAQQIANFERLAKSYKMVDEGEVSGVLKQLEAMKKKTEETTKSTAQGYKDLKKETDRATDAARGLNDTPMDNLKGGIQEARKEVVDFGREAESALQKARGELEALTSKSSPEQKAQAEAAILRQKAYDAGVAGDWEAAQQFREAAALTLEAAKYKDFKEGAEARGEHVTIELMHEQERALLTAESREDYEKLLRALEAAKKVAR